MIKTKGLRLGGFSYSKLQKCRKKLTIRRRTVQPSVNTNELGSSFSLANILDKKYFGR
jgi:hypothetical protein